MPLETTMEKMDALAKEVCVVRGHVETMNSEMGELRDEQKRQNETLIVVRTDVSWLKRFFWIVATASIGSLVGTLLQLVTK